MIKMLRNHGNINMIDSIHMQGSRYHIDIHNSNMKSVF